MPEGTNQAEAVSPPVRGANSVRRAAAAVRTSDRVANTGHSPLRHFATIRAPTWDSSNINPDVQESERSPTP